MNKLDMTDVLQTIYYTKINAIDEFTNKKNVQN